MERALIRAYRRAMPRRLLHRVPSDAKDRLLRLWRFAMARPGPRVLWQIGVAAICGWRGDARGAMQAWGRIAGHWPETPPDLVRAGLRGATLALAEQTPGAAQRGALLAQVLADLTGPHEMKTDTALLDALRDHVQAVLPPAPPPVAVPGAPRRIVLCLDILKITGGYTHGRAVFSICRNLLLADPGLRIDLVISHEHLATGRNAPLPDAAALHRRAGAEGLPRDRFAVHVLARRGLAAVVEGCRDILALAPDLVLFGGGHRGPVSNESRVLRHCLFPRVPVAFFFFQASDQVDDRCDLIIARGPHRIEGRPGAAMVRIQPYPTLDRAAPPAPPPRAPGAPVIVSAIVGARMEARLDELGQRRLKQFLTVLDPYPDAVWHFIGAADPAALIAGNAALRARAERGQVVVHPVLPAPDFAALTQRATLFLHLPGFTGGSGGAGVARAAGVAILTFAHSDVAGRQPPETVFDEADIAPCIALAQQILRDPATAAGITARQSAHSAWIRETAAQGFLDCLAQAQSIGRARSAREGAVQKRPQPGG